MDDLARKPQTTGAPAAEPSGYETFKTGLRQILSVSKSEIDKAGSRLAEGAAAETSPKKESRVTRGSVPLPPNTPPNFVTYPAWEVLTVIGAILAAVVIAVLIALNSRRPRLKKAA